MHLRWAMPATSQSCDNEIVYFAEALVSLVLAPCRPLERCLDGPAICAGECRRGAGMLFKALGQVDHPLGRVRAFPGDMRLAAANAADKLLHELFCHVPLPKPRNLAADRAARQCDS
jgi:hypothetical protein